MALPSSPIIIQAAALSKQVQSGNEQLQILQNINLSIHDAETVAIIGASGSGKSTLLSLLAGLDVPSSGEVILHGKNLNKLDEDGRALLRADLVGFIFQSFHLLPSLTALENVMLPLELKNAKNTKQQAQELLIHVGLNSRAHHYPQQLSGGEQQRVAIARAFITKPKILFADEITGSLDTKTGTRIADLLFTLNAEQRTTLVLVTHEKTLATRCQRCLELEGGKLV